VSPCVRKVRLIPLALRALPMVIRAKIALKRTTDLNLLLVDHDIEPRRSKCRQVPVESLRRGVDAALRLVGPRQNACVPRALALFALLSRYGYAAVFVSGVRMAESGLTGHAWVLVDELPLAPDEQTLLATFREQLRFENQRQRQRST
jgi:hypothetical protein